MFIMGYIGIKYVTKMKDLNGCKRGIMKVSNKKPNYKRFTCNFLYGKTFNKEGKVEVEWMAKEVDLKSIALKLSKLGVTVTMTKSRLELLKALAPPTQTPQSLG